MSTEHGINVQDLNLPEESPEWAQGLYLAIKVNNTKLDTKFAEAKKDLDSLTGTISDLTTTVSSLSEANESLTQQNTQLKEDLLQLEYHKRRNHLVFDGIPEKKGEANQSCYEKIQDLFAAPPKMNVN